MINFGKNMSFFSEISFTWHNGWLFSLLYFVLSTALLLLFPKYTIPRFTKVPDVKYVTQINYILYYAILIFLIFLPFDIGSLYFIVGASIFTIGIILYAVSLLFFAISEIQIPVTQGIYKFSRHPVYLSFFILMIGAGIATQSIIVILLNIAHFINAIFLMKEEEKSCIIIYGNDYKKYQEKVRMII